MSTTRNEVGGPDPGSPNSGPGQLGRRRFVIPAPRVFWPAIGIIVAAILIAVIFPQGTAAVLEFLRLAVVEGVGWYYLVAVGVFVVFAVWMGLSRFGNIKLGGDEEKPEFSMLSWFAMLFAAGMGIGLVFWGAAEPLVYFTDPKPGVEGDKTALAEAAMEQTFFHWGFHAWAIYAVVGLSLAYAIHRKGRPVSIRWALEPLLGDRVRGPLGDAIDVIAVVGTLFGIATSLGLGVGQISAGLAHLGVVGESSLTLQVILIACITLVAIASCVTGVGKGVKWLSNINLGVAGIFLISLLLLGPTLYLLRELVESFGSYIQHIIPLTFDTTAYERDAGTGWQGTWTIFYWGWWVSWAPFVGVFIARISRGRTVREFIMGVLLVPTLVTFIWFSVLGGIAIDKAWADGNGGLFDENIGGVIDQSQDVLFNVLTSMPGGTLLSVIAVILVAVFFVTSSDSGSLVIDMLSSGGDTDPPTWSRVLWASMEGLTAIVLMIAGGLVALQTGSILMAVPVSIIMLLMCVATFKALNSEHQVLVRAERRQRREELQRELHQGLAGDFENNFDDHFGDQVDERIEAKLEETIPGAGSSDLR